MAKLTLTKNCNTYFCNTQINPQHSCPTICDNGFNLWESRPIMTYLADKYGKNDSLYPKDPQKRAVINQRLYFDAGTLFQRFTDYLFPQLFFKTPADADCLKKLHDSLAFLETFLDGETYVAGGKTYSLADIALVVSVTVIEASRIDLGKYTNINRWYAHCKATLPAWEIVDSLFASFAALTK